MISVRAQKNRLIPFAFCWALMACIAGLSLFLIKSPQQSGTAYIQAAHAALIKGEAAQAVSLAREGITRYPAAEQGWNVLIAAYEQAGDKDAARSAKMLRARLLNEPNAAPVFAGLSPALNLGLLLPPDIQAP
jgi:Tfp pilus assembly protein PilF